MDCRVKPGNDDAVSGRPCERRDPYAAASLSSAAAKRLSNNGYRWLWVPAFAGTTMILTRVILPDGQINIDFLTRRVQPLSQKYSDFQKPQITGILSASRSLERGAARDRHGRWERDAVDATGARWTRRAGCGRRSRVVLTPRRWRQVATMLAHCACDGGKKARSPGRARRNPLKPLRRECWVISVDLW
jgi:hypothetical protein